MTKVKAEIDLLKPKQDQIWLGFKRMDGTNDGKWLDIEYDKVPSYCVYCKMQGHYESQCRTKMRNEIIKAQKEDQARKAKEQNNVNGKEEEFQTVSRRKGIKNRDVQQQDQYTWNTIKQRITIQNEEHMENKQRDQLNQEGMRE